MVMIKLNTAELGKEERECVKALKKLRMVIISLNIALVLR